MIRYMVVVLAKPIFCGVLARPILADIEAGPEKMKSLLPGHRYQTLFSWFRVQNKPYHCMIQYMVVVLAGQSNLIWWSSPVELASRT